MSTTTPKTVEGIYRDGKIELQDATDEVEGTRAREKFLGERDPGVARNAYPWLPSLNRYAVLKTGDGHLLPCDETWIFNAEARA